MDNQGRRKCVSSVGVVHCLYGCRCQRQNYGMIKLVHSISGRPAFTMFSYPVPQPALGSPRLIGQLFGSITSFVSIALPNDPFEECQLRVIRDDRTPRGITLAPGWTPALAKCPSSWLQIVRCVCRLFPFTEAPKHRSTCQERAPLSRHPLHTPTPRRHLRDVTHYPAQP